MKQSDSNFEADLARHYQQSKSTTKAPIKIKQNLLLKATRADKENYFKFSWNGIAQLAFAASVLALGFMLLMPELPYQRQQIASQDIIEFHTLADQPPVNKATARTTISLAYAKLEQEYARKTLLIAALQKQARLEIKGDGSWQLNTCEQHNMLLSVDLVAMLDKYQLLPQLPQSGMMVNIDFDAQGHIIQIEASQSSMLC